MIKIIDWYIIKKFLVTFFYCLILFLAIGVIIDISERADDFAKANLTTNQVIAEYYYGFVPRIAGMLYPLFVFIAVIFFTSLMAARSEIIAIMSSGVTYRRFLSPYIITAFFLTLLLWLSTQFVIPKGNRIWADFQRKYMQKGFVASSTPNKNTAYLSHLYFRLDNETYMGIRYYDTITKTGQNIFIQQFKNHQLQSNVRAANFRWDTLQKKNRWEMQQVVERYLNPENETLKTVPTKTLSANIKPIDLRDDEFLKDQLTTPELDAYIRKEKTKGSSNLKSLLVERYNRDAIPFSVMVLTLIGVALSSRKVRGGSGVNLALGFVLCMVYIIFSRFSGVFATQGSMPALLATWLPNIVFGILAIFLLQRAAR